MFRLKQSLFGQPFMWCGCVCLWAAVLIRSSAQLPAALGGFGLLVALMVIVALLNAPFALFAAFIGSGMYLWGLSSSSEPTWLQLGVFYLLLAGVLSAVGLLRRAPYDRQKPFKDTEHHNKHKLLACLISTAEVRDSHTQGHCKRVANNAVVLGERLGMSERDLDTLYWAALLHDIGKLSVPEYILKKETRLSDAEYEEIKKHPDFGAQLLLNISNTFGDIAKIVRCHHERYDGRGYPRQLCGETIPLMSRIISIVDVFEALTSVRAYRQPMLPTEAAAHLLEDAGQQFDPGLLELFKQSYENKELTYALADFEVPERIEGFKVVRENAEARAPLKPAQHLAST